MTYDNNDGPIYSVLTGKLFNGYRLTNAPTTGYWQQATQNGLYPIENIVFCNYESSSNPTNSGYVHWESAGVTEPFGTIRCTCSGRSSCFGNARYKFSFFSPGIWDNWTGWALNDGNGYLAYNNSTDSSTLPTSGWKDWPGGYSGPGADTSPVNATFVLTAV